MITEKAWLWPRQQCAISQEKPSRSPAPLPFALCVCVSEAGFISWQQEFSPSFHCNWELQWCKIM